MLILGIVPVVLILLGVAVLLGSSDERRRVRSLPLSSTASLPDDGEVKVQGKAFAYEPLVAPLSGKACVLYRLVFSRWVGAMRNRRLEEDSRVLRVAPGFALIDAAGKLVVEAEGADVRCETVHTAQSSIVAADERLAQAIREHAVHLVGEEVRAVEEIIPEGDVVLAIGTVNRAEGTVKLAGPRLLLSRLSETALTKWDSGDFAGIGLLAGGVLVAAALVFFAFGR